MKRKTQNRERIPAGIRWLIEHELYKCTRHGPKYASAHEAHSVILEELEEFWEIVRQKRNERNPLDLQVELSQVAATAIKAMQSIDRFVDLGRSNQKRRTHDAQD